MWGAAAPWKRLQREEKPEGIERAEECGCDEPVFEGVQAKRDCERGEEDDKAWKK